VVLFQVSARTSGASRSTMLTIAGHPVELTQSGRSLVLAPPTGLRVVR
jgi:hypothetical protein